MLHGRIIVNTVARGETRAIRELIRRIIDRVLSGEWIKLPLHQEVKEVASGRIVRHVTVQVNSPEQWVTLW